jgi:flagellar basal-body rod modification protein FlgD
MPGRSHHRRCHHGAIDLASRADNVKVDILSAGGRVVQTIDLGPLQAGRHTFEWDASKHPGVVSASYRVNASYTGKPVTATQLVRDAVHSVSSENGSVTMELRGLGNVAYSSVKAIL